jgi:hypothetical protein
MSGFLLAWFSNEAASKGPIDVILAMEAGLEYVLGNHHLSIVELSLACYPRTRRPVQLWF